MAKVSADVDGKTKLEVVLQSVPMSIGARGYRGPRYKSQKYWMGESIPGVMQCEAI